MTIKVQSYIKRIDRSGEFDEITSFVGKSETKYFTLGKTYPFNYLEKSIGFGKVIEITEDTVTMELDKEATLIYRTMLRELHRKFSTTYGGGI